MMRNHFKRRTCLTLLAIIASQFLDDAEAAAPPALKIEQIERARLDDDGTLAAALAGSDAQLARRAALALGRTKRASAAPLLRARLGDRDPTLRALATFGLGLIGRPEDLTPLVGSLRHDPSSAVRYAAADAIGRIAADNPEDATAPIAQSLIAAMAGDADDAVRGHAAASLDVFSTIASAPLVASAIEAAFAREPSATVRWHEMWVLYRAFAAHVDQHFLAAQLQSPDELVRIEALRAVAKRKDPGADHFVRPLEVDSSWRVQLQARETLLALAGQPPTEHLASLPPALNLPEIPAPVDPPTPIPIAPLPARTVRIPSPPPLPVPTPVATFSPLAAPATESLSYGPPLEARTAESFSGDPQGPHPRVRLHTSRGDIVLRLFPEWAPVTVANFLQLSESGYYDGNRWFRIVPDFVHQTGDRSNDPDSPGPGYAIGAEENPIEQRSGVVAMGLDYDAGRAKRDSAGTQFYVTDSPQLHLDRAFTVFGAVESGFDVMANLVESDRILTARRIEDR